MASVVKEPSTTTGNRLLQGEGMDSTSEILDSRAACGLLWLSTDAGLLYMNHRGSELLAQMGGHVAKDGTVMSGVITQICTEIRSLCAGPMDSKEWEQFEIRRIGGTSERPMLVRGFCMPGQPRDKRARVLIMLEPIARRQPITAQRTEHFQLTRREEHIVEHLVKGWTNKEIACALGITEPTVKAHMKHIMEKTKCTTRTGVLAQLM